MMKITKEKVSTWLVEFGKHEHMMRRDYVKPGFPFGNGVQLWADAFTCAHLAISYYLLVYKELNISKFLVKYEFQYPEIIKTINKFFVYKYVMAALEVSCFNHESLARISVLIGKNGMIRIPLGCECMFSFSEIIISDDKLLSLRFLLSILSKKTNRQFDYEVLSEEISTSNKLGQITGERFKTSSEAEIIFDEEILLAACWLCFIGISECEKKIQNFCK